MKIFGKKWGIYQWALVLTLTPLIIISIALGYYNATTRLSDLRNEMKNRGQILANSLASASEYGIYVNDRQMLKSLANSIMKEPDVISVSIVDNNRDVLISLGDALRNNTNGDIFWENQHKQKNLVFVSPVVKSNLPAFDASEYFLTEEATTIKTLQEDMGIVVVALSENTVRMRQKEVIFNGMIITIIMIFFGSILASLIASGIVLPLNRVSETTRRIAEGEYNIRITESSGGELGELESNINTMAAKIDNSTSNLTEQIERATDEINNKVLQLRLQNEELEAAKRDAMEAGQAKSEFLAKMSHEIRTPLNAVIGFSSLLKKPPSKIEHEKYINTINIAARQLQRTVDDILMFSKLEAATSTIETKEFNIEELISEVIVLHGGQAYEKQIELLYFISSDVPHKLGGDAFKINQILNNLVTNAIKFTDAGHVAIRVSSDNSHDNTTNLIISIEDTGKGIASDKLDSIFDAFSQEDASITRDYGGTGLGLTICKKLLDLIGGEITAESKIGVGTTFTVIIPVENLEAQLQDVSYDHELMGVNVLLIENHSLARRAIRNFLVSFGTQVFSQKIENNIQEQINQIESIHGDIDTVIYSIEESFYDHRLIMGILDKIRDVYDGFVLFITPEELNDKSELKHMDAQCAFLEKPVKREELRITLLQNLTSQIREDKKSYLDYQADEIKALLKGKNILVAEDNHFNQLLIEELLRQYQPNITIVDDGNKAVEECEKTIFDIVLIDLHMPGMDGLSATKKIRTNTVNNKTIILAITADVLSIDEIPNKDELFNGVVYKPISETKLFNLILGLIEGADEKKTVNNQNENVKIKTDSYALEKLRPKFIKELKQLTNSILKSISEEDYEKLKSLAHQLKGISGYFGYEQIELNAKAIENAASQQKINDIKENVDLLMNILETTIIQDT